MALLPSVPSLPVDWNRRLFFYGLIAFLVYVFATGDLPKWKQIFTQPLGSGGAGGMPSVPGSGAPAAPLSPFAPPPKPGY